MKRISLVLCCIFLLAGCSSQPAGPEVKPEAQALQEQYDLMTERITIGRYIDGPPGLALNPSQVEELVSAIDFSRWELVPP